MQVTFEFWGALRRAAGGDERTLTALGDQLDNTAVAMGDRLLLRTEALEDGMRLALLPPVAGG